MGMLRFVGEFCLAIVVGVSRQITDTVRLATLLCHEFDETPTTATEQDACVARVVIQGRQVRIERPEHNPRVADESTATSTVLCWLVPVMKVYVDDTLIFDALDYGIIYWTWVRAVYSALPANQKS